MIPSQIVLSLDPSTEPLMVIDSFDGAGPDATSAEYALPVVPSRPTMRFEGAAQ